MDLPDVKFLLGVNELSSLETTATVHAWRALIKLDRYLTTYPERGNASMHKLVQLELRVLCLAGRSATNWAQDVTCKRCTCLHGLTIAEGYLELAPLLIEQIRI